MFKHSVKVPRLYKVAALIAKEVSDGKGSIKQLVYEKQKKHPNIKALYALVGTLYQKTGEIERLLKRSQFLEKEPRLDLWLAKILIVELLWGRKTLPGQSKPENTVRAYEQIFKAHLSDEKSTETVVSQGSFKPRYVRVNSLTITQNEAVEGFRDEGWTLSKFLDKSNYKEFLDKVASLNEDEFMVDVHIPNLLIFPPKTQFYRHPAYKNGSIILQDKASCLPVHILAPPPGSKVLDMCAAPGMKTTHVAAVMNGEGVVYAAERDARRFQTLNEIVLSSGAKCVQTVNKDVLTCNAGDFPGVEYILVDPSCSGSGMSDRADANQSAGDRNRLEKLTGFQIKILRSALTRYPDAKRVVYSTCSLYPEENEDVVRQVLETNYNFKLVPALPFVGGVWQNFGSPEYGDIGKFCLYAKPEEDFTNGFFVAVFERLKEGEENQFFNTKIFNFKKHIEARERRKSRKFDRENMDDAVSYDQSEKNNDISEEATQHSQEEIEHSDIKKNKKKHKKKDIDAVIDENVEPPVAKKKKKSKEATQDSQEELEHTEVDDKQKGEKKHKKKETEDTMSENIEPSVVKKKKKYKDATQDSQEEIELSEVNGKKKHKRRHIEQEIAAAIDENVEQPVVKKKKSKAIEIIMEEVDTEMIPAHETEPKTERKNLKLENVENETAEKTPKKKKKKRQVD